MREGWTQPDFVLVTGDSPCGSPFVQVTAYIRKDSGKEDIR